MSAPPASPSRIESELAGRILVSEQRRAAILARVLTGFMSLTAAYVATTKFRGEYRSGYGWILLLGCFGCAFEWVVSVYLIRAIRKGLQPARIRFYLNALVELSLPTVMILILANTTNPTFGITGPASHAYYLFIILSALRLDFRLCLFTGAVAAAGYALAGVLHWSAIESASGVPALTIRFSFGARVLLLLLGGLVAGFVSVRLRRTLVETLESVRDRERVIALFGQHVSPAVVDQLLTQPRGDTSEVRRVCILVLDIRNFTGLSEKRPPAEVVALLNLLWNFMVRTINEHHGFINKFLGDGFLAVFGAPLSVGNDCQNAFAAARRILRELDALIAAGTLPPIQVGIALHAGDAIVGNIGSAERKEYTVIGDVVNVAFRLEALNKDFGSRLLISDLVRQSGGITEGRAVSPVQVRGRDEPVAVYQMA
ncbi:MAG TPA: adenylate/guanylate cyclase domain-containing protein [Verrucomicrobiota bacterium]|nr:adenylate/guanylate cyclase domain-containing protein [Verrucomicrobiota bacterium]